MYFTKQMIKVLKHFINNLKVEVFEIKFLKYEDKKTYYCVNYLNDKYNIQSKIVYINNNNEVIEEDEKK